jgi:hypothetical protein
MLDSRRLVSVGAAAGEGEARSNFRRREKATGTEVPLRSGVLEGRSQRGDAENEAEEIDFPSGFFFHGVSKNGQPKKTKKEKSRGFRNGK